jgi:hypothetical protein
MSTVTEKRPLTNDEHRLALESVRKQMLTFGNQMHEYFEHIQANVENYKFAVEKHGDGIEIEVSFKAFVHPKINEAAKVIPK